MELRPSAAGNYYGYGWIDGPSVTRQQSFDLVWKDHIGARCHIRSGDIMVIEVANLSQTDPFSRGLRVHGDGEYIHTDESLAGRLYASYPTDWYRLRVEIRSDRFDGSWNHKYRFRVVGKDQFEVEEVRDHNPDTAEGTLHEPEPISLLSCLDLRILRFIHNQLETEGHTFTNRTVWSVLTEDEGAEHCDDRLMILVGDGYISAEVPPNWTSLSLSERVYRIHGLTEKGRAAITRKVQG